MSVGSTSPNSDSPLPIPSNGATPASDFRSLAPSSYPSNRPSPTIPIDVSTSPFPTRQPSFVPTLIETTSPASNSSDSGGSPATIIPSVSNNTPSLTSADANSNSPSEFPSRGDPSSAPTRFTERLSVAPSSTAPQTMQSSPPPSFEPTLSLQTESPVPTFIPTITSAPPSSKSPPTLPSLIHLLQNAGNPRTPSPTSVPRPALAQLFNNIAQPPPPTPPVPAWYSFLVGSSSTTSSSNSSGSNGGPSLLGLLSNSNGGRPSLLVSVFQGHTPTPQPTATIENDAASCMSHDCKYLSYFAGQWVHDDDPNNNSCTEKCALLSLISWSIDNGWQCGTCP